MKKKNEKTYNSRDEFLNDDGLTEEEKIELTELIFKELGGGENE